MDYETLFGWQPNYQGARDILEDRDTPAVRTKDLNQDHFSLSEVKNTFLWEALLKLHPAWRRGAQGIGDCVSWGYELAATTLAAYQIAANNKPENWIGEYATEPLYGLMRVEAIGQRRGGYSDGAYGAAAAKAVTKYGCLHRKDYSEQTGNSDHNLVSYSSERAKQWGNYGCGGRDDSGSLDNIARQFPIKSAVLVESFDEAAAAIMRGCPVAVCSMQGFSDRRDQDGFCRAQGSWAHCMVFLGVRFDRPGLRCFNSWAHSVDGPDWPITIHPEISKCSWWADKRTVDRMLREGDSYALSGLTGIRKPNPSWGDVFSF